MKNNQVLLSARKLMSVDSDQFEELRIATQNYIETICLSSSSEIEEMLNEILKENYIGFPFWARLVAFRFLCLLEPNNTSFKSWAESDISAFGGPDFDNKIKW